MTTKNTRRFHGWRIVGAASGFQFLQAGLLTQAFGAYVAVLSEERGWSKTGLSGGAALQSLEAAVLGPVLGWLIDRMGARPMIRVGVVIYAIGFTMLGAMDSLATFYAAVIVIAIGSSLCGYFPLTVAIVHWFERKRARALAIMSSGLALGGLFVPVVAWSIQSMGWRVTAFASGALLLVVGLPLANLIHRQPQDIGQTVDGLPPEPRHLEEAAAEARTEREFTAREALATRAFWLLSLGHAMALLVVTSVSVHAITHMKAGLGYSVAQASLVITVMTVSQLGGVALGAMIGDRYDKRRIAAVCMLMHAAGLLLLTFATGWAMLLAFALLHGVAWGLRGPMMQAIRADYFGRRAIGMILGLSSAIIALGQIAGPMTAGVFADLTGDYRMGFTVLAITAASGSLVFLAAKRPVRP